MPGRPGQHRLEGSEDPGDVRALEAEHAVCVHGMDEHHRIGFENQDAAVAKYRKVDACIVQVHPRADRRDRRHPGRADRVSRAFQKATLLLELPRMRLHIGRGVVNEPVR